MKEKIQRFFQGRYGMDELNQVIFYAEVAVVIISLFSRRRFWIYIFYGLFIVYIFRLMSKNIMARYKENQKWIHIRTMGQHTVKAWIKSCKDKDYKYFVCPNCAQMIRVPKGKGTIEICCPSCKKKFTKRS